ncbi:MAG: NepR family anti-sigma factor [Pseudomonadota bacterium]
MSQDEQAQRRHDLIESSLKRLYQENVQEELPARFTDMIARLRGVEPGQANSPDKPSGASEEAE